jgi:cardiolipin synthase
VRHLPNLICLLRIALVWPVAAAMWDGNFPLAVGLFFVAAISDGLDGYLAKRFGWTSQLGKVLDPVADKLLLVTVFISAAWLDVMIGLGALIFRLWFGPLKGRPTVISKFNTLFQLGYLVSVMLIAAFGVVPQELADALAYIMFATTLLSGADYLYQFTRRAWDMPPGPIRPAAAPASHAGRR